jgi:hypothetical protein
MRGKSARLLVGAVMLLSMSCGVRVAPEEKLVFRYSEGIQSLHEPTYRDYYLVCHPEAPSKTLEDRIAAYKKMRDTGAVTFSPDGVEVFKLGALGRGAYFRVREAATAGDTLKFKTVLRPDYLSINFTETPKNAVLFIMGEPLGKVVKVKPGKTPGPERTILQSVDLEWTWTKLPPGSPVDWCLQSVLPVPGSAEFRKIQFREEPLESPLAQP